jgi:hypothetical protein
MDPKEIDCEFENRIGLVHYEIERQVVVHAVMKVEIF